MISKVKLIMILWLGCSCLKANGQIFKEWFRQKQTQREYLMQQIAALKVYGEYLNKGYGIVRDGTDLISEFTDGEFSLHRDYFHSLDSVNPELLKNGKVQSAIKMHEAMQQQRSSVWSNISPSEFFNATEKRDIRKHLNGMEQDCDRELEELLLLLTDGKLELTDDERLKRIDRIYKTTQGQYTLHGKVTAALTTIRQSREQEAENIKLLRRMYGFE